MFRRLPEQTKKSRLETLSDAEVLALNYDWSFNGRPSQFAPPGDWYVWLVMAGRGFGKTRCGAEQVREWHRTNDQVNLVGATVTDARDIMIEGESGILAICPKSERPTFIASKRQLQWPNGAKSLIFTADEPERMRGKQHRKLWCDEVGAWRYADEAWDQAMFGLRLGDNPQAVVTTTPRPIKLVKQLLKDPGTVVTRGSTYDNRENLARKFFNKIITKYEGTRLGRQELMAELLEDNPGALWTLQQLDSLRRKQADIPMLVRVVTGLDPSVKDDGEGDECGIVVAALGMDNHFYVLDDLSDSLSPDGWARKAINEGHHAYGGDRLVAEINNGGALVESVLRTVDENIPYTGVHASRGKKTRAEPIAALYEQGRVHHVGTFAVLEDQMCEYDPLLTKDSPDRMDALVHAMTDLVGGTGGLAFGSLNG